VFRLDSVAFNQLRGLLELWGIPQWLQSLKSHKTLGYVAFFDAMKCCLLASFFKGWFSFSVAQWALLNSLRYMCMLTNVNSSRPKLGVWCKN